MARPKQYGLKFSGGDNFIRMNFYTLFVFLSMYEKKIPKNFDCGISVLMEIIGGKWKSYLIFLINSGVRRPSEIQRAIPEASRRALDLQLRELEFHGIVKRIVYPGLPVKVEYFITELGETVLPVVNTMDKWGTTYLKEFEGFMKTKTQSVS